MAAQPITSFRVGLENIHKRYQFFTTEKIIIRDDDKFLVQLPVLKKEKLKLVKA
jgi:hypothetical protein